MKGYIARVDRMGDVRKEGWMVNMAEGEHWRLETVEKVIVERVRAMEAEGLGPLGMGGVGGGGWGRGVGVRQNFILTYNRETIYSHSVIPRL
jgi:hypothetical protein